jgi:hypothetical protein
MCQIKNELLNVRPKRPKAVNEEERKQRTKEYQREYQKKRRENDEKRKRHTELCRIHNIYAKKAVAYCKAMGITFDDD